MDPFVTSEELEAEPAPVVVAGFDGECTWCEEFYGQGDDIRSDGQGGWKHADCEVY
jgi:hypothetical protein